MAETVHPVREGDWFGPYDEAMLPLYRGLDDDASPGIGFHSLGADHCPTWLAAVEALPTDRLRLASLVNRLLHQGRAGEALALQRHQARLFPQDPLLLHDLATLLLRCGDDLGGERLLREVLTVDPGRGDTVLALAQQLLPAAPQEARALLCQLDPEGPLGFSAGLTLLPLELAHRPEQDPPPLLDRLLGLCDEDPDRQDQLVRCLFRSGWIATGRSLAIAGAGQSPPCQLELLLLTTAQGSPDQEDSEMARGFRRLEETCGDEAAVILALGAMEARLGRYAGAERRFRNLLERDPSHGEVALQLAAALFHQGELAEAHRYQAEALCLLPFNPNSHYTMGFLSLAMGAPRQARASMRSALLLMPRAGDYFQRLGDVLRVQGDLEMAERSYRVLLAARPGDALATASLGTLHLQRGDYRAGWPAFEARLHPSLVALPRPIGLPRWDGESALDELVLVAEQGAGDLFQFMRYVAFLRLFIPRVSILAEEKFHSILQLFAGFSDIHIVGRPMTVQGVTAWMPLLSLAGLLQVTPSPAVEDVPYLQPQSESVRRWRRCLRSRLEPGERLIALNWQGNPATEFSSLAGRSLALQRLAPLADVEGIRFVSLQKGAGASQWKTCSFRDRFVADQMVVDDCIDFVDSAAIIAASDLVISSDSAVAHLAGAQGHPTWLLLATNADWRWELDGERTQWYPSLRLFRQTLLGEWEDVVLNVRNELIASATDRAQEPPDDAS